MSAARNPAIKRAASQKVLTTQKSNVKLALLNKAPTQKLDIYVFGSGQYGELGLGSLRRDGKKPTDVKRPRLNDLLAADTVGVVQLDVGGMHTIALTHDNKIYTWGVNDDGALGRDTTWVAPEEEEDEEEEEEETGINPRESTPSAIPKNSFHDGAAFVQVAATDNASFALTDDGQVYGWGTFRGNDGIIGFSRTSLSTGHKVQRTPILIPELKSIKLLAAGGNHVQALDSKGNVFSWGSSEQGQLGRHVMENYRTHALTPSQFGLPKLKIKYISSGAYHSFAIDKNERVFAWGLSNYGQTGIPTDINGERKELVSKPKVVDMLGEMSITDIKGGLHHSVACTDDGEVLVWGRCDDGQMGIDLEELALEEGKNVVMDERGKPRHVLLPVVVHDINGTNVAAGIDNTLAIDSDGTAFSWGFSSEYRTGQDTEDTVTEATRIDNSAVRGKKITFVGCGGQFSVLAGPAVPKAVTKLKKRKKA